MEILHVRTGPDGTSAVCSTFSCNCIPQEITSPNSSMFFCSFHSRCSGYLLIRRRAFAETREVKSMAGQLVTITVGFSFDGGLQLPRLADISLAPVISLFLRRNLSAMATRFDSFVVPQLDMRQTNCMCTGALCSSNLSLPASCDSSSRSSHEQ